MGIITRVQTFTLKLRHLGKPMECNLCGYHGRFRPTPEGLACVRCGSSERNRLYGLWLKRGDLRDWRLKPANYHSGTVRVDGLLNEVAVAPDARDLNDVEHLLDSAKRVVIFGGNCDQTPGLEITEFSVSKPDISRYGLLNRERIFVVTKAA